jgi:membrane-bound lytic murein transglycosylase F
MMMITQATAKDLGISNRMDPRQSLRGGARFLKNLLRRLPADIDEPDRTWMALAAYNIGMGHLEDARVLTERAGLDPHLWEDVRGKLPGLQDPKIYPTVRYGFARGREAVTYVDNIRHYFSALKLSDLDRQRIQPPVQAAELLPDAAANYSPVTL